MNIYPITQNNFSKALELLKKNNLPTEDITGTTTLFVLYDENELIGTVGLETYDNCGLLRSLCVSSEKRNHGAGIQLVEFLENFARTKGIQKLYLLTTTASEFFNKRNYKKLERSEVPEAIKQTTEFSSVCPSSAIVMKKELA